MPVNNDVQLNGVLAVVTPENCNEPIPEGVGGVEVRVDLFDSHSDSLEVIAEFSRSTPVLATPRHPSQGGAWDGSEEDRATYCLKAFEMGATLVDLEHGTEAAVEMISSGKDVLLSWHDFDRMISAEELVELTASMEEAGPKAIKVVPTARCLGDSVQILDWAGGRSPVGVPRIGFAMGASGIPSRILSLSRGAPWTYAAHGNGVAPGQVAVRDLIDLYGVGMLDRETRVLGVAGNPVGHSLSPHMHNPALRAAGINAVYIPFHLENIGELEECWDALGLDGLSVTIPFKLDAMELADEVDGQAQRCGAANTLVRKRQEDQCVIAGYNTDFNGVLDPLKDRIGGLEGVKVAVIGNGGAARGAVRALLEAGARPTIYCRNLQKGKPVAEELGVDSILLDELAPGHDQGVIINATSLGLNPGDPSPVTPGAFKSRPLAFDMVYDPPETRFLQDAMEMGAEIIKGDEMLVAQGLVQFELFTGKEASKEDFLRSLQSARTETS